MIAVVVGAVIWGAIPTLAVAAAVAVLMMFDVTNALNAGGYKVNRIILLLTAALIFPAVYFFGAGSLLLLAGLSLAVMSSCVILSKKPDFKGLFGGMASLVYPFVPASLLICLAAHDISDPERLGCRLLVYAVLCACLSDALAYFGGKLFGKRKLCPQISPKKTVAGSIASFVGGTLAGCIIMLVDPTDTFPAVWIAMGLLCGGFAQIGDLVASMLKRFCSVKDYGKYIPGHGGIMDRMDSISICLIVIVTFAQLFLNMEIL